jgi:hypothetical protein
MRTNCLNTRAPSRRSPVSAEASRCENGEDDGISALSFDAYLIKWTNHEYDIRHRSVKLSSLTGQYSFPTLGMGRPCFCSQVRRGNSQSHARNSNRRWFQEKYSPLARPSHSSFHL